MDSIQDIRVIPKFVVFSVDASDVYWTMKVFTRMVATPSDGVFLGCGTISSDDMTWHVGEIGSVHRTEDGRVYVASLAKLSRSKDLGFKDWLVHIRSFGNSPCLDNLLSQDILFRQSEPGKGMVSYEDFLCHEAKRLVVDELKVMGLI